jgi:hypothetical protein
MTSTQKHTPTPYQRRCLQWIDLGGIEVSIQTGLSGAALDTLINSCIRRGWVIEDGGYRVTDAGRAALAKAGAL